MKVLVTGGAGFGGSGLAKALLDQGHKVTVFDETGPLMADRLDDDVLETENLSYCWKAIHDIKPADVDGHDIVVHFQAQSDVPLGFESPTWTTYQNVMGTVALLEACRSSSPDKVIYAGSGNELGRPRYLPIDEEHPLTPHNPYSFSKAAAELACWAWHRCYGVPIVVVSNGVVIGPGMRKEIFIFKWLWAIAHDRPLVMEGGDQTRDVTYVADVVDAWVRCVRAPVPDVVGEKFQVSYGEEHSLVNIAEMCFEVTGKRVPLTYVPHRPGEAGQREHFTNQKARRVLGYNPQVPPKEAIRLTWEWMKGQLDRR